MKAAIRSALGVARRLKFARWRAQSALRLRWLGVSLDAAADGVVAGPLPRIRLGEAQTAGSGSLRLRIGDGVRFEPGVAIDLKGGTHSELVLGAGVTVASGVRIVLRGGSVEVGRASQIHDGAVIKAAGRVVIGEDYQVRYMSVIHCEEAVTLEGGGGIADRVTVADLDHDWDGSDMAWHARPLVTGPIHIGRNTTVYSNSVVMRGVTIGPNSVVSAGSVVRSGDYPAGSLLAGVPAKLLRTEGG